MNKKTKFVVATAILLSAFFHQQSSAMPIPIICDTYNMEFKVEGLSPSFFHNRRNDLKVLMGKTIDSESELFRSLKSLDSEYNKHYWEAKILGEKLFDSAMQKDTAELWRQKDCVNFDFDQYIRKETDKPKLDALWKNVYEIESKMKKLILSYFGLA